MHQANAEKILSMLAPTDLVLDVGGWACPFNRAQWVLDAQPYNTRGFYATFGGPRSQGGDEERFSRSTWVQQDICDRRPWPFEDNQFDFSICSHTLEDLRDPIWVCSELERVSRRGYIEVPSRAWETTRGIERSGQVGLAHHRWLVEVENRGLAFYCKPHSIHSHWRFSLPRSFLGRLPADKAVEWLFWEDHLPAEERFIHGAEETDRELEAYVRRTRPYPAWAVRVDLAIRRGSGRIGHWLRRASELKPSGIAREIYRRSRKSR
jgi:hypothetical protein